MWRYRDLSGFYVQLLPDMTTSCCYCCTLKRGILPPADFKSNHLLDCNICEFLYDNRVSYSDTIVCTPFIRSVSKFRFLRPHGAVKKIHLIPYMVDITFTDILSRFVIVKLIWLNAIISL